MSRKFFIVDGHTRHRASLIAELATLPCIVWDHRPSPAEILETRLNLDIRSNLKPIERAKALSDFMQLTGCTLVEACKRSGISQSLGSKLVPLLGLAPELQQKVNEGWGIERAYVISREPDHEKQRTLAAQADQARGVRGLKVRAKAKAEQPKLSVARFHLPGGGFVSVQVGKPTLCGIIDAITELTKQLKKAQAESLDLGTTISVLRDKAKSVS